MKEIFKTVLENYKRYIHPEHGEWAGLCYISWGCLRRKPAIEFKNYLKDYFKDQKIFFKANGLETSEQGWYVWKVEDVESRIEWLEEQILKHS